MAAHLFWREIFFFFLTLNFLFLDFFHSSMIKIYHREGCLRIFSWNQSILSIVSKIIVTKCTIIEVMESNFSKLFSILCFLKKEKKKEKKKKVPGSKLIKSLSNNFWLRVHSYRTYIYAFHWWKWTKEKRSRRKEIDRCTERVNKFKSSQTKNDWEQLRNGIKISPDSRLDPCSRFRIYEIVKHHPAVSVSEEFQFQRAK